MCASGRLGQLSSSAPANPPARPPIARPTDAWRAAGLPTRQQVTCGGPSSISGPPAAWPMARCGAARRPTAARHGRARETGGPHAVSHVPLRIFVTQGAPASADRRAGSGASAVSDRQRRRRQARPVVRTCGLLACACTHGAHDRHRARPAAAGCQSTGGRGSDSARSGIWASAACQAARTFMSVARGSGGRGPCAAGSGTPITTRNRDTGVASAVPAGPGVARAIHGRRHGPSGVATGAHACRYCDMRRAPSHDGPDAGRTGGGGGAGERAAEHRRRASGPGLPAGASPGSGQAQGPRAGAPSRLIPIRGRRAASATRTHTRSPARRRSCCLPPTPPAVRDRVSHAAQ